MQNAASSVAAIEVTHDLRLWFERVPSYSNPADGPSRGSFFGLATDSRLEICIEDIVCKLTSFYMRRCQPSPVHLGGNTRRVDDLWIAFVPIGKKERCVRFNLTCRCRLFNFLDVMIDCLIVCFYMLYVTVYMYMFTVVPARCVLDYVWILSLDLAGLPSCKCIAIL